MKKSAIVLCSGGIDSVTTAHYTKKRLKYKKITILFFNYGQKSLKRERKCARMCASDLGAEFMEINLPWLGEMSISLINKEGKIKKLGRKDLKNTTRESKNWYVPCRNMVFLGCALAFAEAEYIKNKSASEIFVGFKNDGAESFPDTTPGFVDEMNRLGKMSCSKVFEIIAPLIEKDKEDIILIGKRLGIDFRKTHSCYVSDKSCGKCLACMLRKEGFYWANSRDDIPYQA